MTLAYEHLPRPAMTGIMRLLGTATALALLVLAFRGAPAGEELPRPKSNDKPAMSIAGSFSCSGRGCHGGLSPVVGDGIRQDEYTRWLLADPHANAFHVLGNERSRTIAKLLGIEDAQKSVRCLACHVNPTVANDSSATAVVQERYLGVGCESCHGAATQWLAPHTTGKLSLDQKAKLGMTATDDVAARAKVCAGCHVGAGPDGQTPVRDVNHDLIAAGHPRMNFEFAAFMANLPAHWRPTTLANETELSRWMIGQTVSADAALQLLSYRSAGPSDDPLRPWPEFAEYECYACHHDLTAKSWRQERGYTGRPGALPWGSWHLPVVDVFASLDKTSANADAYRRLRDLMARPVPERGEVSKVSRELAKDLGEWSKTLAGSIDMHHEKSPARAVARFLMVTKETELKPAWPKSSWDGATQRYLSLAALDKAHRDQLSAPKQTPSADDDALRDALAAIFKALDDDMSNGGERFDSPKRFSPGPTDKLFDRVRELLKK